MLCDIDNDLRELLLEDIAAQVISYSIIKKLTGYDIEIFYDSNKKYFKLIEAGVQTISVFCSGRTSMIFSLIFREKDKEIAMRFVQTLHGLVKYNFQNTGNQYYSEYRLYFSLDIGSKKDCMEFFNNLSIEKLD